MFKSPLQVDFDITMKCMYKCRHCNVAAGKSLDNELTTDEIKKIIDELYMIGVCDLSLTGGEPLLRKDCLELLEYASQKKGMMLTLNTNGLLLSKNVINFLEKKCPNLNISVSLDGYNPQTYRILRRNYNNQDSDMSKEFKIVKNNLLLLGKSKLSCGVNFTVTESTIPYLFKTFDYISTLGIDKMLAIKFFPYGYGRDNRDELELRYESWENFIKKLLDYKKIGKYEGIQISVTCPWEIYLPAKRLKISSKDINEKLGYNSPLESELYKKNRDIGCHAGITSCAICANGDVYPCGTISANFPPFVCGNLKENTMINIWKNSTVLKHLREIKINDLEGNCINCDLKSICGGGCRARAYTESNKLNGKDYLCPIIEGE